MPMKSIFDLATNTSRHKWVTAAGNINATGWTSNLTFGARTITVGGAVQVPDFARSVDALILQDVSDGAAAAGGATARKFSNGILPNYIMANLIASQTTAAEGYMASPQILNPNFSFDGPTVVQGCPGPTDLGSGTSQSSMRFSASPVIGGPLRWLAAEASSTSATDLLDAALTAIGGDTLFPFTVSKNPMTKGIRALGAGHSSDFGAGASSIAQVRLEGDGLRDNNQDVGGTGVGGEVAATSADARTFPYWDEWLEVNAGSQIDWLAGITGVDSGTQIFAGALALQL